MKTVTMRVDDITWRMISAAAEGQRRSLSNFLEFAVLQYLSSVQYVDDEEMEEVMRDKELVRHLQQGMYELKRGEYTLV
jgi:predicted transcriptional regulator